jgi:hypothetical protein
MFLAPLSRTPLRREGPLLTGRPMADALLDYFHANVRSENQGMLFTYGHWHEGTIDRADTALGTVVHLQLAWLSFTGRPMALCTTGLLSMDRKYEKCRLLIVGTTFKLVLIVSNFHFLAIRTQ